jgi:hypothetical protein
MRRRNTKLAGTDLDHVWTLLATIPAELPPADFDRLCECIHDVNETRRRADASSEPAIDKALHELDTGLRMLRAFLRDDTAPALAITAAHTVCTQKCEDLRVLLRMGLSRTGQSHVTRVRHRR